MRDTLQPLYFTKQTKRGRWRLYKIVQQAVTAWRGSNDKTSVVRFETGGIVEHDHRHTLVGYCQDRFGCVPLYEHEVDQ